jgi:hypothetical protein
MYEQTQPKSELCRLIQESICELEQLWGPLTQSVCFKLLQAYELVRQAEKGRAKRKIYTNGSVVQ